MSQNVSTNEVNEPDPQARLHHVSPKLVPTRLITFAIPMCAVFIGIIVIGILTSSPAWLWTLSIVLWVGVAAWIAFVIVRQVPALGYLCRNEDLLIKHGIMFRRSTLVPYGRMQYVEVTQGPIARRFGLASVELHTAAALSDASIDGLPKEEAEKLRDFLAARGESDLAGL